MSPHEQALLRALSRRPGMWFTSRTLAEQLEATGSSSAAHIERLVQGVIRKLQGARIQRHHPIDASCDICYSLEQASK
jgi:DNA-binding MarR family transcriptional regulator